MNRSLQRHLSLSLAGTIVVAGLAAAAASFALAYFEAKEFQDDMLQQIAHFYVGSTPVESTTGQRAGTAIVPISDPEARFTVIHLPRDPRPDWLDPDLAPGIHTVRNGADDLRVFVLHKRDGGRTIAAQSTAARDEIAVSSALRTLVPLLILLPVLVWLVVSVVRNQLAPIARISKELELQRSDHPGGVPTDGLPAEIVPFVHAINRTFARIEQMIGRQRRFIADAAHELRSPLAALSLQAQNLLQASSLDTMRERGVTLQTGVDRACRLTEQLLSLARTQEGANDFKDVDVSAMARESIAQYLPLAEARGIDLGLDESGPLSMHASFDSLRLIMRNGLDNALKFTPDGGEVTLRLIAGCDEDVIEIVDNGPGIPSEERERVVDAFYRLPESPGEGSGLGLAIAREAADRLGGELSLHGRRDGPGLIYRYRQTRQP